MSLPQGSDPAYWRETAERLASVFEEAGYEVQWELCDFGNDVVFKVKGENAGRIFCLRPKPDGGPPSLPEVLFGVWE